MKKGLAVVYTAQTTFSGTLVYSDSYTLATLGISISDMKRFSNGPTGQALNSLVVVVCMARLNTITFAVKIYATVWAMAQRHTFKTILSVTQITMAVKDMWGNRRSSRRIYTHVK